LWFSQSRDFVVNHSQPSEKDDIMKKPFLLLIASFIVISCGGGGGDGGSGGTTAPVTNPNATTTIVAQTGVPALAGFDLQFKQGDWWLYDWKDVSTTSISTPSYAPYYGIPTTSTSTDIGTARITLGTPKTILGITFFQVVSEYTGNIYSSNYIDWQYLASFNNKIYGCKDDQVFLIFDAQNGAWVGGTFFGGVTPVGSGNLTLSLGTRSDAIGALPTGVYSVDYQDSGLWTQEEYFTQGKGPSGYYHFNLTNSTSSSGLQFRGTQTFTLAGSNR
jgi:hypothetical protein